MTITRTPTGATLRIALPFVDKSDIDLARHGDELVVTVGSYRRLLALPAALTRHTVSGARIEERLPAGALPGGADARPAAAEAPMSGEGEDPALWAAWARRP